MGGSETGPADFLPLDGIREAIERSWKKVFDPINEQTLGDVRDELAREVHQAVLARMRGQIVEVLCSQALADHLGDVRDAEEKLWRLLGIDPRERHDHPEFGASAFAVTADLLRHHGYPLPGYLRSNEDDGETD